MPRTKQQEATAAKDSIEAARLAPFFPYPSFDNLRRCDIENLSEWSVIATEKLHGSNFCLAAFGPTTIRKKDADYLQDIQVRCAKRTGWIAPDENFYCWQSVLERYREPMQRMFVTLKTVVPNTSAVYVYGELYGGHYPHEAVAADPNSKCVQRRVWYRPNVDFAAFDVRVVRFAEEETVAASSCSSTDEKSPKDLQHWLPWEGVLQTCSVVGIPTVPEVACADRLASLLRDRPTLNSGPSQIPGQLSLPDIKDNIAEGVVLRLAPPVGSDVPPKLFLKSAIGKFGLRFKMKHPSFEEVAFNKVKKPKNAQETAKEREERCLKEVVKAYANANRVSSLESKIGKESLGDRTQRGAHLSALAEDAARDIWKDYVAGELSDKGLASGMKEEEVLKAVKRAAGGIFARFIETACPEASDKVRVL